MCVCVCVCTQDGKTARDLAERLQQPNWCVCRFSARVIVHEGLQTTLDKVTKPAVERRAAWEAIFAASRGGGSSSSSNARLSHRQLASMTEEERIRTAIAASTTQAIYPQAGEIIVSASAVQVDTGPVYTVHGTPVRGRMGTIKKAVSSVGGALARTLPGRRKNKDTEPTLSEMVSTFKQRLGLSETGTFREVVEAAAEQLGVEPDGPLIAVARICMDRIHVVQRLERRFNTVKIPSINVEVVGTPMGTRIS